MVKDLYNKNYKRMNKLRQEAESPPCHKIGEFLFLNIHTTQVDLYILNNAHDINANDTPYIIRKTILKFVRNSRRSGIGKEILSKKNKVGCIITSTF